MLCRFFTLVVTIGFVPQLLVLQEKSAGIRQFQCLASNITIIKDVQKQLGGKECALPTIANATSVAFGKDPSKMAYQESVMHEHLY